MAVMLRLPTRTTSPSCSSGCRRTVAWCGAANRSASGRWSGCECVTRTTPTVLPASRLLRAARCRSSSGSGSITATTGPASTIHVLVPGPVYGPGLGATTLETRATDPCRASRSTRAVGGQVQVGPVGAARVEPAVQLGVDDQAHERLSQLRDRERLALAHAGQADFPPGTKGLSCHVERVSQQPVPRAAQGLDEERLNAEDRRVGRHVAGSCRKREVQDRAQDDAASAVLRLDRGSLEPGRPPSHLLRLLEQPLEHVRTPESRLPRRLLERKHRRTKLVAQAPQQVVAVLPREALPELGGLPGHP